MLEAVIAVGVVIAIGVGFYLTRGAGGLPGGVGDPARNQLAEYSPLGDRIRGAGTEAAREHEDEDE